MYCINLSLHYVYVYHCAAPPSGGVMPSEPLLSAGDKLTLTCTFVDCAENINCTFYWLLDGSPVEPSLVTVVNTTTSRLSVNSVTSADFGTYTCQVTSACGMGTAVAYVRERGNLDICIPAACTFTPPGNSTLWQSHLYAYLSLVRGSAVYCIYTECCCVEGSAVVYFTAVL